jgi:hypothetical protein
MTQEMRLGFKGDSTKKFLHNKIRDKGLLWDFKGVGVLGLKGTSRIGKDKGLLKG